MARVTQLVAALAAALTVAACSFSAANETGPADSSARAATSSTSSDSADLARLEREALALVHNDGCDSVAQCRVAPVGAKACGGPRYWITFCSTTTDSAALFRKLEELRVAEQAFNQAHGIISDCSIVGPPSLVVSAGVCRAGP
ncbi:MAG TPA: hypothetical protein VIQ60_03160 [Gemmatimonadaceae bacterium]|jgi:hypothetical protein